MDNQMPYASTPEPEIVQGKNPEQSLQRALMAEVHSLLTQAEANFILLEGFGLDIAAFIHSFIHSFSGVTVAMFK